MSNLVLLSEEVLKLTRSMLEAAKAADWEKLGEKETLRQVMLNKLSITINALGGGFSAVAVGKHMREALSLNDRITELALQAKAELASVVGNIQQGRKAMNAYYEIK